MRTNPVCWFEVGDFLDYMRKHRTPSGIQRVEREILTGIEIDHVPSGRAAACRLDRLTHEFEPVDLSFLTDPMVDWMEQRTEPERRSLANIARRLLGPPTMRGEAPRHQIPFTDGDVLVSLGGAWHDGHYPEAVARLRRERGVRVAFQLYDIIPVTHPAWVVPTLAEGFRSWIREMVAIADLVFTSSHHVRRELLAYVSAEGLRQPPIAMLRFASGFERWNPAAPAERTPGVALPRPFALFVSTFEFRKNHRLLIQVWRRLIEKHGWAAVPHLVFVGRVAFGVQDLMRELDESRNLDGKIIVASELTDAELEQAYLSCRITVFPSLEEGWGLPVAESLVHGKLCVASNRTSISEIGGDLVDYFDPDNLDDALRQIERALYDADYLATREQGIRSTYRGASWKAYTDELMLMLGQLSSRPARAKATPNSLAASAPNVVVRTAPRRNRRQRILVLKLDHLGDLIMAVPALRRLRDKFPGDEITLVCGSWNKTLAEGLHIFDSVLTHDYQSRNARVQGAPPLDSMSHFDSLLSGPYDIAIDLKVDADTRVFLTRVDAAAKCGFGSTDKFPYLDVALPLGAGRVALPETGAVKYAFAPVDFFSRVPGNALFLETDFTFTDLCIIYGPYAALPRGDYFASFYFTAVDLGAQDLSSTITFDVAKDEKQLASMRITKLRGRSDLRKGTIVIPFSNDDPDGLFEFRVSTKSRPYRGSLRFFGVTVESMSHQGKASHRQSDKLHLSELMALLVQLVAERFGPPTPSLHMDDPSETHGANHSELEVFLRLKDTILIAPFSNKATRDWPLSHYEQLIDLILSKFDNPIGLLGASEHVDALNEVICRHASKQLFNLAGKTEWSEMPRVLKGARAVVSNNSGIAHFAAACGAPLIAIYSGAVLAEEWGPRGENTIVTLTAEVPCSPCGHDKLEQCAYEHRCMRLISAEHVFAEISKLLEAAS